MTRTAPVNDEMCGGYLDKVIKHTNQEMFGLDDVILLSLVSLYTGGHVLLEGNPGLGKTMLVRTLTRCLGFGRGGAANGQARWGRIQFTPDLMPADITGTNLPGPDGVFAFQAGPIFRWLLLADEINRATPKTQAAMLEGMAEKQVTVLGKTHTLVEEISTFHGEREFTTAPPFIVFATQNPIEQEGTYGLPEAQADRFMFKIRMQSPERDTLAKIVDKDAGPYRTGSADKTHLPVESEALAYFRHLSDKIRNDVKSLGLVTDHVLNMVLASNLQFDGLTNVADRSRLERLCRDYLQFGLGPRAATAMVLGAKGWSVIHALAARRYPGDSQLQIQVGLANVALPALRHRLRLVPDWEFRYAKEQRLDGKPTADILDHLLIEFVNHAAPRDRAYRFNISHSLV